MAQLPPATVLTPMLLIGAALMLGACSPMTTYGTGTTAGAQTIKDISGMVSLGAVGSDQPKIEYEQRAPIVQPPATALPPPGSETTVAAAGNDWPVDPDAERERIDALVKERNAAGEEVKFAVPEEARVKPVVSKNKPRSAREQYFDERMASSQNSTETKKMSAVKQTAKVGSFDEDGNPARRYLIEPPPEYREPDLASPVDITEKPKKKKGFKLPDLWPF